MSDHADSPPPGIRVLLSVLVPSDDGALNVLATVVRRMPALPRPGERVEFEQVDAAGSVDVSWMLECGWLSWPLDQDDYDVEVRLETPRGDEREQLRAALAALWWSFS